MMRQVQTFGLPEHIQNSVFWSLTTTASDTYFGLNVWLFLLVEVPHHYSIPPSDSVDIGDVQCQLSLFKVPLGLFP